MMPPETSYALAPDSVHIAYQVTGRPAGDAVDLVMMQGTVAHLEIALAPHPVVRAAGIVLPA